MAEGTGCIHGSGVSLQRFQQAAEQSPPRPKSASLTQAALRPPGPLLILQKGEAGDRASMEQLGGRQPFQSGLAETLALSTSLFPFCCVGEVGIVSSMWSFFPSLSKDMLPGPEICRPRL